MRLASKCTFVCVVASAATCTAQVFTNLDFELASSTVASLPPGQGEMVRATNAFPGWQVFLADQPRSTAFHNTLTAGSASTSILGPFYQLTNKILEGSFTAVLQPGDFINGGTSVSLVQTAQVPPFANSLQFKTAPDNTNLLVSVGGQILDLRRLERTVSYDLYGADLSTFAGQIAELRFTGVWSTSPGAFSLPVYLDAIQFSATAVPEPSTWALFGLASAFSLLFARLSKKAELVPVQQ